MGILATLSFIDFRIIDVLDILIVAILLFEMYKLTKGTAAVKLFWLIAFFYVASKVVAYFHFTLLSELIGELINVGILAIIIIFQPEIRKEMAETKTGALIIFARQTPLDDYLSTGETIDAKPSAELLENIFFKNSPLHDGAVIIKDHRIAAARCILPVSKNKNLPQEVGLRHRSALGSTEFTDAIAVIVSEQTGTISICKNGQMTRDLTPSDLRQLLLTDLAKPE